MCGELYIDTKMDNCVQVKQKQVQANGKSCFREPQRSSCGSEKRSRTVNGFSGIRFDRKIPYLPPVPIMP